jgi:hypothetical protein
MAPAIRQCASHTERALRHASGEGRDRVNYWLGRLLFFNLGACSVNVILRLGPEWAASALSFLLAASVTVALIWQLTVSHPDSAEGGADL